MRRKYCYFDSPNKCYLQPQGIFAKLPRCLAEQNGHGGCMLVNRLEDFTDIHTLPKNKLKIFYKLLMLKMLNK